MNSRFAQLGSLLVLSVSCGQQSKAAMSSASGSLSVLDASRQSPHAYGRRGDLLLSGKRHDVLTFAATADARGHRPLRGALLDFGLSDEDRSDPLLWWRPGWLDSRGEMHALVATIVEPTSCDDRRQGVAVRGIIDGVSMESRICARADGDFDATTSAQLPPGAHLGDELHPGTAFPIIAGEGEQWDGRFKTPFVALSEGGLSLVFESGALEVERHRSHIAAEVFTAPVIMHYPPGSTAKRTLRVVLGDACDALASVRGASLAARVGFGPERGGTLTVRSNRGTDLVHCSVRSAETRPLLLPLNFGSAVALRDEDGIGQVGEVPLWRAEAAPVLTPPARSQLILHYVDERGEGLPVHVLFRGLDGTPDPLPRGGARAIAAGRSLYLLDGAAAVALAPGSYRVTASHGPAFSLSERITQLGASTTTTLDDRVRRVVDTSDFVAADFHLHAAPSPDAPVSLQQRVASLACEGVEFAVATDHNRVTSYGPSIRALGLGERLMAVSGAEVTSAGSRLWGHFNAFPLPIPTGAPEDGVPPYFDILPGPLLAATRSFGARIVQVNHGRMEPRIGYFDLAHLDPKTGQADPEFSGNFDAVEAFNGIWLETPEKVREGARDLIGLARRGQHPTATGNSDSHRLLYEEAGYPRTYVRTGRTLPEARERAVIDGLLRGATTVSSGPFVELTINGQAMGSVVQLSADGSVSIHVRVSAPDWVPVEHVEVWLNELVAQRFDVLPVSPGAPAKSSGLRFEGDVTLRPTRDAVVLAWADAETPLPDVVPYPAARAIGFTGLSYIDADGDGKVVPPRAPDTTTVP